MKALGYMDIGFRRDVEVVDKYNLKCLFEAMEKETNRIFFFLKKERFRTKPRKTTKPRGRQEKSQQGSSDVMKIPKFIYQKLV